MKSVTISHRYGRHLKNIFKMNNEIVTRLDLQVIEKYGKIINKFKILYYDWETDNHGYVVNDGNRNMIVTTNHGRLMETSVDYLKHKIREYEYAVNETKKAIEIFENGKN